MNVALIIVLLVLAVFLLRRTEYFGHKHSNAAYLIHEATSDQCYECRAIRNYFYNALGDQNDLDLHSYHTMHDYSKISELENKYGFKSSPTPVLLVVHDEHTSGSHEIFYGYPAVHQAITSLRFHPYIERRLNL